MNAMTYSNLTTCKPLDFDQLKQVLADFDAKYPKSERCKAIEVDLDSLYALKAECPPAAKPVNIDRLYGLPVIPRFDVPAAAWIAQMADGSRVIHYPSGFKVRCLPDKEPEPEWLSKPIDFDGHAIRFRAYWRS